MTDEDRDDGPGRHAPPGDEPRRPTRKAIMRDPMPTLADEWEEFKAEYFPGWPPARIEPMEKLFHFGFLSMLSIALEINNSPGDWIDKGEKLKAYYDEYAASRDARPGRTA